MKTIKIIVTCIIMFAANSIVCSNTTQQNNKLGLVTYHRNGKEVTKDEFYNTDTSVNLVTTPEQQNNSKTSTSDNSHNNDALNAARAQAVADAFMLQQAPTPKRSYANPFVQDEYEIWYNSLSPEEREAKSKKDIAELGVEYNDPGCKQS